MGWDNWITVESEKFSVEQGGNALIKISGNIASSYWVILTILFYIN